MSKKDNTLIYIAAIVVGLMIVNPTGLFSTIGGGFGVLSAGQVQFESNDNTIGGQAWLISLVQNGNGQLLTGTFNPSDIQSSDGKQSTTPFTFQMSLDKNEVQYPLVSLSGTKLYWVNVYDINMVGSNYEAALKVCKEQVGGGYDVVNPPAIFGHWYCLQRFESGYLGQAGTGTLLDRKSVV